MLQPRPTERVDRSEIADAVASSPAPHASSIRVNVPPLSKVKMSEQQALMFAPDELVGQLISLRGMPTLQYAAVQNYAEHNGGVNQRVIGFYQALSEQNLSKRKADYGSLY